jgi:hypothetical protein
VDKKRNAGWIAGLVLAGYALLGGAIIGLACAAGSEGATLVLPEQTPSGLRVLLVLVGLVSGYFLARTMLRLFVERHVSVDTAVDAATSCLFFATVSLAGLAAVGVAHWIWVALLFVGLLIPSLPAFWRLAGTTWTMTALVLGIVAGVLVLHWAGAA